MAASCGGDDDEGGSAADDDKKSDDATVKITKPGPGVRVKGNVISLHLESSGVEIKKADRANAASNAHYHVYVDKSPVGPGEVIPRAADIIHSSAKVIRVTGLTVGEHTLTVVLGDGAHKRIGSAEAKTTVNVEGPSVDAIAPPKITADEPFSLEVKTEGVQLTRPDGDKSKRTGHLHVYVDKRPSKDDLDKPIPTGDPMIIHSPTSPVPIPALAAGQHTLWVVLGDGAHVPFKPLVADQLIIRVE